MEGERLAPPPPLVACGHQVLIGSDLTSEDPPTSTPPRLQAFAFSGWTPPPQVFPAPVQFNFLFLTIELILTAKWSPVFISPVSPVHRCRVGRKLAGPAPHWAGPEPPFFPFPVFVLCSAETRKITTISLKSLVTLMNSGSGAEASGYVATRG